MFELRYYRTAVGTRPLAQWLDSLRDRNARARLDARIDRLERGLVGDCKPCGDGVWELRIDWGPGYRIYYAQAGNAIILLLCGGDKRNQQADIKTAKGYWNDYLTRQKAGR